MKTGKSVLAILSATIWISLSEFIRNQFLLKSYWIDHYKSLGLVFPEKPVNGAMWGVWSLVYAIVIFFLAKKFPLFPTVILAWLIGFVMMWIVIGNLGVLPYRLLVYAVPLSILEAFVASVILFAFLKKSQD
jgi:hypothetical protein